MKCPFKILSTESLHFFSITLSSALSVFTFFKKTTIHFLYILRANNFSLGLILNVERFKPDNLKFNKGILE